MSLLDIVDNIRIFPQTEKNRKEASEYLEELRKSSINTLKEAKSRISQFTESPKKKPNSFWKYINYYCIIVLIDTYFAILMDWFGSFLFFFKEPMLKTII